MIQSFERNVGGNQYSDVNIPPYIATFYYPKYPFDYPFEIDNFYMYPVMC